MEPSNMSFFILFRGRTLREKKKATTSFDILHKAMETYNQGLDAERLQLPCFLPYNSENKLRLEEMFRLFKQINNVVRTVPPKTTTITPTAAASSRSSLSRQSNLRLNDPRRIELFKQHREYSAQLKEADARQSLVLYTTVTPRAKQQLPKSLVGLKSITLKEMDPTKDHVYDGFVLSATIIEHAYAFQPSIRLLIEDENLDIERMYIYDFPATDEQRLINKVVRSNR